MNSRPKMFFYFILEFCYNKIKHQQNLYWALLEYFDLTFILFLELSSFLMLLIGFSNKLRTIPVSSQTFL